MNNNGFVYFISAYHMVPCGYFKVGITNTKSYKPRLNQIQSNSPFAITAITVVKHSSPIELEQLVLDRFKRYRIRGEWFCITPMHIHGYDKKIVKASRIFERKVASFIKRHCDGEVIL